MRKGKIKIEPCLFYLSYFIFSLYAYVGSIESFNAPLKYLTNISMAIIILEFIIQLKKYKYKELFIIIFLLILSFIYVIYSNNYLMLKFVLIVIAAKNISANKLISYDAKLRVFLLIVMCILFATGISSDNISYFDGKIRHSMGFTNPNVFGYHILILCIELIYLNRSKLNIFKIILFSLLSFCSYLYSGSRTAMLLYVVLLALFLMYKHKKNIYEKKMVKKIIIYSPIITSILIYVMFSLYKKNYPIGIEFDKLLSGRLFNIDFFSSRFPVNFFGSDIAIAHKSCDTANVYMLYAFGLSGFLLYNLGIKKLFDKLYALKQYPLIIIMFVFVIYGISEKLWLFADCNLLLVIIFKYLFFDEKGCETNE